MVASRRGFLEGVHNAVAPRNYLEIGVSHGGGLSCVLSTTYAVGIDPAPHVTRRLSRRTRVLCCTSDEFFDSPPRFTKEVGFDLMFVDGLHLSEQAQRDLFNCERVCAHNGILLLDDVLPPDRQSESRRRMGRAWTGDVWKLIPMLLTLRPDLSVRVVPSPPTGIGIVEGFNRASADVTEQDAIEFMSNLSYDTDYQPNHWPLANASDVLRSLQERRSLNDKMFSAMGQTGRTARKVHGRAVRVLRTRTR